MKKDGTSSIDYFQQYSDSENSMNMTGTIVLYDDACNLCNKMVYFLIKRTDSIRFAALESRCGKKLIRHKLIHDELSGTLILQENGEIYTKSDAVLRIIRRCHGFWSLLYALVIIPKKIRNRLYDIIAANRYIFFEEKAMCSIRDHSVNDRFSK